MARERPVNMFPRQRIQECKNRGNVEGCEYLHSSPASRRGRPKIEPGAWEYNWATSSMGDINTGTWPSTLGGGGLESETVKYGHETRGTQTRE
jgi:hypothetical protein